MSEGGRAKLFFFLSAGVTLLTLFIASTTIRIELANAAMSGYLPRPQPPSIEGNDIPWRVGGPYLAELSYRQLVAYDQGLQLEDQALFELPLDQRQQAELSQRIERANANVKLHGLVSTVGLLQYPLVFAGFLGCVVLLVISVGHKQRLIPLGLGLVISVCAGFMFYREYWSSLGP